VCVFVSVTGRSSTSWLDKGAFVPEHGPRSETRPLSALISNLKHHRIFVRKSFGNSVIMQANAISFKPGLCFDQLDLPRIGARQEIFQEKRGYVSTLLRGMSGRRGKSEGKKTGNLSTVTLIPSAVIEPRRFSRLSGRNHSLLV